MIPAFALSNMRAIETANLDLPDVEIQRSSTTQDAYGNALEVFTTISTSSAGLGKPSQRDLAIYADRIGELDAWLVRFAYGTDLQRNDQVVFPAPNAQTMRVQAVLTPRSYQVVVTGLVTAVR